MSDLVGNPEDQFSHIVAHLIPSISGMLNTIQAMKRLVHRKYEAI